MSLTPAQVEILVNVAPFQAAMRRMIEAINATEPELRRLADVFERLKQADRRRELRRIHTQYRRKSRGHR